MADEENTVVPTNIEATTEQLEKLGNAISQEMPRITDLSLAFNSFGNAVKMSGNIISSFANNISGLKEVFEGTGKLTTKLAANFGLLASAMLATEKTFDNADFGSESLNTMEGQLSSIVKSMVDAGKPVSDFVSLAASLGIQLAPGAHTLESVVKSITHYAENTLRASDNTYRMQNAFLRMSAATGGLDEAFAAMGSELETTDAALGQHLQSILTVSDATGESYKQVSEYYMQLGLVPGALQSNIRSSHNASENVSMLAATMQYAKGSGRDFKDVVEDLNTAFVNYDMVGEDALKFTARMGEVSNKYNVQLNIVRDSLRSTAEQLRMFGHDGEGSSKIMEGAAKIMNQYTKALKDTGISGAAAVGIIGDITKQISGMDVAQRSFVSSQTGGAGGLRGAFQIEKMMREGDMSGVMEKVRQSLTKQFGKIVSVEEAAGSERAAAMLVKQRMMLQQGPLGNLVQDEQQAGRLLEAFRTKETGTAVEALSPKVVQDTMGKGVMLQQQANTFLHDIRRGIDAQVAWSSIMARGALSDAFAYRRSTTDFGEDTREMQNYRDKGQGAMERGARESGVVGAEQKRVFGEGGAIKDQNRDFMKGWMVNFKNIFDEAPEVVKNSLGKMNDILLSGGDVEEDLTRSESKISDLETKMLSAKDKEEKEKLNKEIEQEKARLKAKKNLVETHEEWKKNQQSAKPTHSSEFIRGDLINRGELPSEEPVGAANKVGDAATRVVPVVVEAREEREKAKATEAKEGQRTAPAEGTPVVINITITNENGDVEKEEQRRAMLPVPA